MVWEDMDVVWEVFIIPERLPLCPEVEFWKNETIFGISGSFVFFEASIIKSLKTPFNAKLAFILTYLRTRHQISVTG